MKNNATCTIRSEEITIDVRICAALAAEPGLARSTSQPLPRIWS